MIRSRLLLPLSLALAAGLLGCGGSDMSNDNLPTPAIFESDPAVACAGAGAVAVSLSAIGAQVVEGFPQSSTTGPDRIRIDGVTTPGETVYGLLIDDDRDCPIEEYVELVADAATGAFTVVLPLPEWYELRVVAVTGPAGALPTCGPNDDCIQLDVTGVVTPVTGISNGVGVRL